MQGIFITVFRQLLEISETNSVYKKYMLFLSSLYPISSLSSLFLCPSSCPIAFTFRLFSILFYLSIFLRPFRFFPLFTLFQLFPSLLPYHSPFLPLFLYTFPPAILRLPPSQAAPHTQLINGPLPPLPTPSQPSTKQH